MLSLNLPLISMTGYARRYFVLKHDGVLIYSTQPGSSPRDSIPLRLATVTSSERAHQITVDSGTKTFHIRCFSPADFEKWMSALKYVQMWCRWRFIIEPRFAGRFNRRTTMVGT